MKNDDKWLKDISFIFVFIHRHVIKSHRFYFLWLLDFIKNALNSSI